MHKRPLLTKFLEHIHIFKMVAFYFENREKETKHKNLNAPYFPYIFGAPQLECLKL